MNFPTKKINHFLAKENLQGSPWETRAARLDTAWYGWARLGMAGNGSSQPGATASPSSSLPALPQGQPAPPPGCRWCPVGASARAPRTEPPVPLSPVSPGQGSSVTSAFCQKPCATSLGAKRFVSQAVLPLPGLLNKGGGRAREDRAPKLISRVFSLMPFMFYMII